MNRTISELLGNLTEIEFPVSYHLLGGLDFFCGKIFDDSLTALFLQYFLKLGTANHIIFADLFQCQMKGNIFLHIVSNMIKYVGAVLDCGNGGTWSGACVFTVEPEKE